MSATAQVTPAPLPHLVGHVVVVGSKPEVALLADVVVRERCGATNPARFRSLLPLVAAAGLIFGADFASASSLWLASQEAGARPDVPKAVVVPVEKVAA